MTNTRFMINGVQLSYPGHENDWRQHQNFTLHNQFDALDLRKRRMILKQEEFEQRMARLQSLDLSYSGWQQDLYKLEMLLVTNDIVDGSDHHVSSSNLRYHEVDFDTLLQAMLSKQQECEESNVRRQEAEHCPSFHPSLDDAGSLETDPSNLPFAQSELVVHPIVEPGTTMAAASTSQSSSQNSPRTTKRSWSLRPRLLSRGSKNTRDGRASSKTDPSGDHRDQLLSTGIGNCVVCLTQPKEVAVVPCGHLCMCTVCSEGISKRTRTRQCPICRQKFRSTLRVFV